MTAMALNCAKKFVGVCCCCRKCLPVLLAREYSIPLVSKHMAGQNFSCFYTFVNCAPLIISGAHSVQCIVGNVVDERQCLLCLYYVCDVRVGGLCTNDVINMRQMRNSIEFFQHRDERHNIIISM